MSEKIEQALSHLQEAKERRSATQMYILCYDEIDLYVSALWFLCECGQEKIEESKEVTP